MIAYGQVILVARRLEDDHALAGYGNNTQFLVLSRLGKRIDIQSFDLSFSLVRSLLRGTTIRQILVTTPRAFFQGLKQCLQFGVVFGIRRSTTAEMIGTRFLLTAIVRR